MILCIANVLSGEQLKKIESLLQGAKFRDGSATAGWSAKGAKNNLQLPADNTRYRSIAEIVLRALAEHEVVQSAALPRLMHAPLVSRYEVGMGYGSHVDNAFMGSPPSRTDLSYTLFLRPPTDYEGGELVIEDTSDDREYKLDAGAIVLYPSTALHHVAPVTAGVREVVVGWIESLCSDPRHREVLFDLAAVRRQLFVSAGKSREGELLSKTYSNLLRLFAG